MSSPRIEKKKKRKKKREPNPNLKNNPDTNANANVANKYIRFRITPIKMYGTLIFITSSSGHKSHFDT